MNYMFSVNNIAVVASVTLPYICTSPYHKSITLGSLRLCQEHSFLPCDEEGWLDQTEGTVELCDLTTETVVNELCEDL